jgi:hypothetical protein
VEAILYVNTTTKVIRAALTGTALPSVPIKLQTHLKLTVYFFATGDTAAALLSGSPTFRVALKDKNTPSGSVLALLSAPTATNVTSYEFEWASVDSAALRTFIGDAESVAAVLEISWTIGSTVERVALDVTIQNAWIRTADAAPDFQSFVTSITSLGYLRLVNSEGTVFHIGLNTGEPPSS